MSSRRSSPAWDIRIVPVRPAPPVDDWDTRVTPRLKAYVPNPISIRNPKGETQKK